MTPELLATLAERLQAGMDVNMTYFAGSGMFEVEIGRRDETTRGWRDPSLEGALERALDVASAR